MPLKTRISGLILDMDGVLWRGHEPFPGLAGLFQRLQDLQIHYAFATNNSSTHPDKVRERLKSIGIVAPPGSVITSSVVLAELLIRKFPKGGPVYIIGEAGLEEILNEKGFHHSNQNAIAVIVGLDRSLTYQKLSDATLLIRAGVPFYGTNPDKTYPTPHGLTPGAGSILAAIQAATGFSPILAGKPHPEIIRVCLAHLQTNPCETLVVGDRLDTDILSGINAGCPTGLVMTGVTTRSELEISPIKPDLTAEDIHSLIEMVIG